MGKPNGATLEILRRQIRAIEAEKPVAKGARACSTLTDDSGSCSPFRNTAIAHGLESSERDSKTTCARSPLEEQRKRPSPTVRKGKGQQTFDPDSEQVAFAKIQRLLCRREHASSPLRDRLVADGFSESAAGKAVQRAIDCGLVSDERFADVLVRSRMAQGRGMAGIARELEQACIDPESVPSYVELMQQHSPEREVSRAVRLLEAKPPRAKRLREAAYRKLVQKGYSTAIASQAARIFSEQHDISQAHACL